MNIREIILQRINENKRSVFLFAIGILVIIAFSLFALVAWPRISREAEITLNGSEEVTVTAGTAFQDEGATAVRQKQNIDSEITVSGDVDENVPGTYELTYSVEGRWNTFSVTRRVTVVDETAPEITLNGESPEIVESMDAYEEPGVVAMDNCDGDLSDSVEISSEQTNDYSYTVTYSVTDSSGNTGTAERIVMLPDSVSPEIALLGDEAMTIQEREKFVDPGVTASDDRDGDITDSVVRTGFVDIYRPGEYTVTYTAKDTGGNESTVTRDVTVERVNYNPENALYLTFDDGPSSDVTPQILDILAANHIEATFFICNYTEDKIPIIQRMINEGHTIGIHGWSHDYATIYASTDAFMENIHSLRDKLKEDTGYEAFCIRFPGGSSNAISAEYTPGIMSELVQMVTDDDLMYVDWNVSSHDAESGYHSPESIIENVSGELRTGRTNIVLMHDISTKQTTADALQGIIDYGKENGYNFCPIEPDTVPVHHNVTN